MSQLPEPAPVREYAGADFRTLHEEIRPLGQPAVLRGVGAHWPAVQAGRASAEAAVDYLLSFRPRRPVTAILGAPEIEGRYFYAPEFRGLNFTTGPMPFEAFLARLLHDRQAPRPFALSVQSEVIPELLPGFVEANPMPLLDRTVVPRIWMGNRIRVAPHYDLKENVGVVVLGRRRFTLFPPEQLDNLYIGPIEFTPAGTPVSLVDLDAPDLDRFPRYAEAAKHAQVAELEPGDGIYIPFHWWHGVDSLATANAFVNYWWSDAQPGLGNPYDALMFGLYALRGLPEDQRKVWQLVFERFVFMDRGDPVAHLPDEAKGVLGPTTPEKLARMRMTLKEIAARL